MCTLVIIHRLVPDAPLWVAANRDEYLDRAAEGPALRGASPSLFVAPRDLRAGGTWWGVNAAGVFAAVTNRPVESPDALLRSRGELVPFALAAASAREAARRVADLPDRHTNPANFVAADGKEAFAVVLEGRTRVFPLMPGVHVIGNADPDDLAVPKLRHVHERAEQVVRGPAEAIAGGLEALCREHAGSGAQKLGPCVHRGGYGTRSSTLLRVGGPRRSLLRHAEGPPCTQDYIDFTPLLEALDRSAEASAGEMATRMVS